MTLRLLKRIVNPNFVRFRSSFSYQEVEIPVPWGHVAGKWWGPLDKRPILTLHGWQDNCGSFNRLIPLLDHNVSLLAIDWPGHGYSSRLPPGQFYHYTTYLILIQYLAKYYKWPKISLMGHSMGGIMAFTFTTIFPENVDFLVCIENSKPLTIKNNNVKIKERITKFLVYDELERSKKEPPSYSMEEIKQKVCSPNRSSIYDEYCFHVIERNISPSKINPGKYYFTRDPRLKSIDLMNWSQDEVINMAKRVNCPIFISKGNLSSYYEDKKNIYEVLDVLKGTSTDCQYHNIEGTHHAHLNNPETLAALINQFIKKYTN